MTKDKIIHDTVIVVHKDTIVKTIELAGNKSNNNPATFVEYVNYYSDVFSAGATIVAIIAVIISIFAIYKAYSDSRKHVLVQKLEEMYELTVNLSVEYDNMHYVYMFLEEAENKKTDFRERVKLKEKFVKELETLSRTLNIEDLLNKTMRLNVLANSYLIGELKFMCLGYSQLFVAIIYVLKHKDIEGKNPQFNEVLPTGENVLKICYRINDGLIQQIGYGTDNSKYLEYRYTKFNDLLYPKPND